jgi:hypothetical protein
MVRLVARIVSTRLRLLEGRLNRPRVRGANYIGGLESQTARWRGVELGFGASDAEAASSFCKHRYNICLARCPETLRCSSRCRTQYKYCTNPYPYIGNLL